MLARRARLRAAALGRYASALIFGAWLSATASAEVREPAAERGSVMLAAFNTGRTTDARVDSDSRNGTEGRGRLTARKTLEKQRHNVLVLDVSTFWGDITTDEESDS